MAAGPQNLQLMRSMQDHVAGIANMHCKTYQACAIKVSELLPGQEEFDSFQMPKCYSRVQWRSALKVHGQAHQKSRKHVKVNTGHCKLVN